MVDHGYCSDLNVKFEKLKMLADVSFLSQRVFLVDENKTIKLHIRKELSFFMCRHLL